MRELKVLLINTQDYKGGTVRIVKELFVKYDASNITTWLLVGRKYTKESNIIELSNATSTSSIGRRLIFHFIESFSLARQQNIRGIDTLQNGLRFFFQPKNWYRHSKGYEDFNFPGTKELFRQLPEMPDIIHCHNLHGKYFDLAALPFLSKQRPLILHLHDAWLLSGHCAHSLDCERWKIGCGKCIYLNSYPPVRKDNTAENWKLKKRIYANSQLYILTVSQWLMDKVQKSMLNGIKTRVIHNGVDLTVFYPDKQRVARKELNLPLDAKIVIFSGLKYLATVERILPLLKGTNLLFVCLGISGEGKFIGQGKLLKTGFVKGAKRMAQYFRAADVFLHVPKADSFPTTVIESLACGTPVVANAVGGIPEQIKDGETGFLLSSTDLLGIVNAIQTLIDDDELRKRMQLAAVADARKRFDMNRQVNATLAWYKEVIADWENRNS